MDYENRVEKHYFSKIIFLFFISLVVYYLSYHFYSGRYGFRNLVEKENIIEQKKAELKKLENEISGLKNKINNLQTDNLDSDLFDEEVRKNTGYIKKNEIVIYSDDLKK